MQAAFSGFLLWVILACTKLQSGDHAELHVALCTTGNLLSAQLMSMVNKEPKELISERFGTVISIFNKSRDYASLTQAKFPQ